MIHLIICHIKYSILTCSLYVISFLGFSPNIRLNAKIRNVEKYSDASKLSISPYIYTIEISYGDHQWTIKRRYYFSTDEIITHFWHDKVCLLIKWFCNVHNLFRYKDFLKLHTKVAVSQKRQTLLHSKSGGNGNPKLSAQSGVCSIFKFHCLVIWLIKSLDFLMLKFITLIS